MARLSRTTNPTNLIEIARKDIGLSKLDEAGTRKFCLSRLNLSSYGLDNAASVVVVAQAGNTSRRFDAGIVGAWNRDAFDISGLDPSYVPKFRLLIRKADSARLLATAEKLRCLGEGSVESLLPIESTELGQRLWRLLIDEDGPVLQCNQRVFPSGASAAESPPFRTLVIPEALRQVLGYLAKDPELVRTEGTIWQEWATWMKSKGIEEPPDDQDQRNAWIEESTGRFCDFFRSADELQAFLSHGEPQ